MDFFMHKNAYLRGHEMSPQVGIYAKKSISWLKWYTDSGSGHVGSVLVSRS